MVVMAVNPVPECKIVIDQSCSGTRKLAGAGLKYFSYNLKSCWPMYHVTDVNLGFI